MTIYESFWAHVDALHMELCWEWQRGRDKDGYGKLRVLGSNQRAHRVAWELTYGALPANLLVLHACDNPPCCNPRHLFVGTNADNIRDRVLKGRSGRSMGLSNGAAYISDEIVEEVRARYAEGGVSQDALALELGISQSQVSRLVLGQSRWVVERVS